MQVDPIKPTLKAPRTKRLKLNYNELLSNVAFNVNLRRYILAAEVAVRDMRTVAAAVGHAVGHAAAPVTAAAAPAAAAAAAAAAVRSKRD